MNGLVDDKGYLASGKPARLGEPPPGPHLDYVVPRSVRLEIDREGRPFEQLPLSYDDAGVALWRTVRADNPFDVLVLPESTGIADRPAIDAHGMLLANHWNAKLQISRRGPGDAIEQKYGGEIAHYPDRVAWALEQLHLDGGIEYWLRDLETKRLERARADMQERIARSLANGTLVPEERERLSGDAAEAGYEAEEFANLLLTELASLGLQPTQPLSGGTSRDRLVSGGTWAATGTAPAAVDTRHPHRHRTILVVALSAAAIIILMHLPFAMPSAFEKSIEAALREDRLTRPPNQNAFDLWLDEVSARGRTARAMIGAERIRSRLSPLGEQAFAKWYATSDQSVNWREVVRIYARLCMLVPDKNEYFIRRTYAEGQVAFERGDYGRALDSFSKVLADSPPRVLSQLHALALNGIGRIHDARNEGGVAEGFYESCMRDEPKFAWAFVNRASQRMRSCEWPEADRLLQKALNAAPNAPTILMALGRVCEKRDDPRAALARYQQALELRRDPELVLKVAKLSKKLGITVD